RRPSVHSGRSWRHHPGTAGDRNHRPDGDRTGAVRRRDRGAVLIVGWSGALMSQHPVALLFVCAVLRVPAESGESPLVRPDALVRLTHDKMEKERPNWAPGGRRLLFARHEAGGAQIWQYVLEVGQPGSTPRRLTDRKAPEYNGAYSPDGTRVLFAAITLSGTQG